mmetsp:Transcript_26478/g.51290  ORF Transcript_26478/g.51290 Transcript_26478/m.51290 type:complete len:332 (+) Transcript_26478:265-1260(+)
MSRNGIQRKKAGGSSKMVAMMAEAEKKVYEGDFKSAKSLLEVILKATPKNLHALDLFAKGATDAGDAQTAIKILKHAISIDPKTYHRWMDLAQIQDGVTALKCYRQGLALMEEALKTVAGAAGADQKTMQTIRVEMASGYASVAELFVTDLCDENGAEKECEKAVGAALRVCSQSPEANYAAANLRYIQGRGQDAAPHLGTCVNSLKSGNFNSTYEFRMNVAQLCFEMGNLEAALDITEGLLEEDNRIVQTWYFASLCYFRAGDLATANEYLQRAVAMLKKAPQRELMAACEELHEEMRKAAQGSAEQSQQRGGGRSSSEGGAEGMEQETS